MTLLSEAKNLPDAAPNGERGPDGRFVPGNAASVTHGLRRANGPLPDTAEVRAALAERAATIVSDLGGTDGLSSVALGMIDRHARMEMVAEYLHARLEAEGPLTGKGKTRAALSAWLQIVDRLHRSALALGLERRAKRVPTLAEVINAG